MRMRFRAVMAAVLAFGLLPGAVKAQDQASAPPERPLLRIETGRHAAVVNRVAVDRNEAVLATASDDKTVRLWDLRSGRLISTLRVPIGTGNEGALYTVALSPDAKTVIATGDTGSGWDGAFSLYVFDVERQRLKARLSRLPAVINHVVFSPDGQHFAAVYSGRQGMAVWNAGNGKLVAQDPDYGDIAIGLAFDTLGRLVTVSHDGFVRLYGADFRLSVKARLPADARPHGVAFSPDGSLIAIGYSDALRVDVLSATDLALKHSADLSGLDQGNLAAVAWRPAASGPAELAAAGSARDKAGNTILRIWSDHGRGAHRDIPVARDAVMHLLGLRHGIVYAAADPAWGLVNASGTPEHHVDGQIADFRDVYQGRFAVSADGMEVAFGIEQGGRKPFRFRVAIAELLAETAAEGGLAGPTQAMDGITVSDWRNGHRPKVNGRTIGLKEHELARSATLVPDGRALIGTDHRLGLYDAEGVELASVELPAAAWGVVVSENGKIAVAALGDGTLRWYSLAAGEVLEELIALFPKADGRHWIAWTREGFFGHSEEGGADLAGYHLNRGAKTTPEWFEFSRMYQLYYAPELLAGKVLRTGEAAIQAKLDKVGQPSTVLAQRPSPQIELVEYCPVSADESTRAFGRSKPATPVSASGTEACLPITATLSRAFSRVQAEPAVMEGAVDEPPLFSAELPENANAVKLRFKILDREGGIGDVDVFTNGKIASSTRAFGRVRPSDTSDPAVVVERELLLAPGRNRVVVRAYDATNGLDGRSPPIEFIRPKAAPRGEPVAAANEKPKLHVLAAGIDRYAPPNGLRFAVKDMTDVVAALQENRSDDYADVEAIMLKDEEVTLANLEKAFDDVAAKARPEDTVLVYLSGHGITDPGQPNGAYYYMLQDGDLDRLESTAFSQNRFKEKLAQIRAAKVMLVLDTCHSGALETSVFDKVHKDLENGYFILAAASPEQLALDSYKGINGPFAYSIVEGLKGQARDHAGVVDQLSLGTYVKKRVPALVNEQKPGHPQTARFKTTNGELEGFSLTKVSE